MAKQKANIKLGFAERDDSNFGNYAKDTGGGEAIMKPDGKGKVDSTSVNGKGRGQWEREGFKQKRETDQPRTSDGKFTYNAVNGKPLKDISKDKDGNSRGKTIPPVLTGGQNGVYFEEGKVLKRTKGTAEWKTITSEMVKDHIDAWKEDHPGEMFDAGGKVVMFSGEVKLAPTSLTRIYQQYSPEDKAFGKTKDGKLVRDEKGRATSSEIISDWKGKPGNRSKAERETQAEAEKTNARYAFVKDENGDVAKHIPGKIQRYSKEDITNARNFFAEQGFDVSDATDEEIMNMIDEAL